MPFIPVSSAYSGIGAGAQLVTDINNHLIAIDGPWAGMAKNAVALVDVGTGNPAANVVNTTQLINVYSTTIPGGALGTMGALRIQFYGRALNTTGSGALLLFQVIYGVTTIAAVVGTPYSLASNAAPYPIMGSTVLTATGATNTQRAISTLSIGAADTTAGSFQPLASAMMAQSVSLTVDSTLDQSLQISVAPSTASANFSYFHWVTTVELLIHS